MDSKYDYIIDNFLMTDTTNAPEAYKKVDQIINKAYLPMLQRYPIIPLVSPEEIDIADCTCFFPIKKLVFDKEENNLQKLTSVYNSVSAINASIAMVIRGYADGETEIFLGVCNEQSRINGAYPKAKAFYDSFIGNFPGCRDNDNHILNNEETRIMLNTCFSPAFKSVASVSCVGSLRGQNKFEKNNAFYQGMEKVIEAMSGKEYSIVILAKSLPAQDIQSIRSELESIYTNLSMFSKINFSLNQSEANSVSDSVSHTLSNSISKSKSKSLSIGENSSISNTKGSFSSDSSGVDFGGGSASHGSGTSQNKTVSSGTQKSNTEGKTVSHSDSKSVTDSESRSFSSTKGKSVQLTIENKKVSEVLEAITQQLRRMKSGNGTGLFATSAYFLSTSLAEAKTAAGSYKAVVSGDTTSVEYSGINCWSGMHYRQIIKYLRHFRHPVFELSPKRGENVAMTATPATVVTSAELAIQMGLPQHSISGIAVNESVTFGRNIVSLNKAGDTREKLPFGKIFHLGLEEKSKVEVDLNSLTMHTFITGTTGSGKSNTIYGLLNNIQCVKEDVCFLVVEPAKGEYKTAFDFRNDITVYGVNPFVTPLLRINPFRFRPEIHILEHIDRLLNIFNVCWPMEAAMPAILKQALERAYISAGWDLQRSKNQHSEHLYPTFNDVMQEVNEILDESQYSADNKGDYIGALCTRLRELTTGLNGMMFVPNDLSDSDLFERNVIIDLSRIGSPETKSLIMGLIIIRLQEYRQSTQHSIQAGLNHITVLEEAHHLLKRTSTEQSMGNANLVGKSVEILTNAFAEMRSVGEGFIIVDQSPGLMDKSVIRNTNTKIVLRLPESEDRELVGKAIGLNEMQITEISKLPTGVAVVYQNDWLEAVLAKVPYFETGTAQYHYKFVEDNLILSGNDTNSLLNAIMNPNGIDTMLDGMEGDRIDAVTRLNLPTKVKRQLINYVVNNGEKKLVRLGKIACDFFNVRETISVAETNSLGEWINDFKVNLKPSITQFDEWDQNTLLLIIGSEYARRYTEFEPIYLSLVQKLI